MGKGAWIAGGVVAMLIVVGVAGGGGNQAEAPPRTFGDVKREKTDECIRQKGHGSWRGSLGVSLVQFCATAAAISTNDRLCREYPERC